jgi:YD repeat-containing protein
VTDNRPVGNFKAVRFTTAVVNESVNCRFAFEVSFDSLGRVTSTVATPVILEGGCGSNSQFYDAWDSEGRPTHGTANGAGDPCVGQDVSIDYDDESRVVAVTQTGGTDCFAVDYAYTYDANGNVARATSGGEVVYDNTTLETQEICVD